VVIEVVYRICHQNRRHQSPSFQAGGDPATFGESLISTSGNKWDSQELCNGIRRKQLSLSNGIRRNSEDICHKLSVSNGIRRNSADICHKCKCQLTSPSFCTTRKAINKSEHASYAYGLLNFGTRIVYLKKIYSVYNPTQNKLKRCRLS
jgi:hypothetical protein